MEVRALSIAEQSPSSGHQALGASLAALLVTSSAEPASTSPISLARPCGRSDMPDSWEDSLSSRRPSSSRRTPRVACAPSRATAGGDISTSAATTASSASTRKLRRGAVTPELGGAEARRPAAPISRARPAHPVIPARVCAATAGLTTLACRVASSAAASADPQHVAAWRCHTFHSLAPPPAKQGGAGVPVARAPHDGEVRAPRAPLGGWRPRQGRRPRLGREQGGGVGGVGVGRERAPAHAHCLNPRPATPRHGGGGGSGQNRGSRILKSLPRFRFVRCLGIRASANATPLSRARRGRSRPFPAPS